MSEQPTILPWHLKAAGDIMIINSVEENAAIIANHDPHHEALRLLEEAKEYLHDLRGEWSWKQNTSLRNTLALADLDACIEQIRAHLAAHRQTAQAVGGGK